MKGFVGLAALKEKKTVVYGVYLLIFIMAFLLRLYNIENRDIWGDEDRQARYAGKGLFDLDMTLAAAAQSQPPTDAFIQSVGIANFGMKELGLRIHVALLGALSVLLFYMMLNQILGNRFAVILASILFAFHPWLIHYAQVGRPAGTGVFFAVLYLMTLIYFLRPAQDKYTNTRGFILLVMVQTWFLLSVGFQPLVFVLVSSLSMIPFLLNKKYFYKTLLVYLASIISFALAFPILELVMDVNTQRYLTQRSLLDQAGSFFKNLFSTGFETYTQYYKSLLENWLILSFIILILGTAGFLYTLISRKKDPAGIWFPYFFIFILVYPLVFASAYKTLINWGVNLRYYLSFTPVLIAGLAMGLHFALSFLTHLLKNKSLSGRVKYLPYAFFLVIFLFSFYGNTQKLCKVYLRQNCEWESLYELFKYDSAPGDTAYLINLAPPGRWVPTHFYSQRFYYHDEAERYVILKPVTGIDEDFQNICSRKQRGDIYLVIRYGSEKVHKSFFINLEDIDIYVFESLFIVRLFDNDRLPENIVNFYYCLAEKLPKREDFYVVHETLFKLEMLRGNLNKAFNQLKALRRIDTHGKLSKRIAEYKEEWQNQRAQRLIQEAK